MNEGGILQHKIWVTSIVTRLSSVVCGIAQRAIGETKRSDKLQTTMCVNPSD